MTFLPLNHELVSLDFAPELWCDLFELAGVPTRDTSLCRRIFARKAGVFSGAWLDDPRCDFGDIAMFASERPPRCARLLFDETCGGAS